jgi:phosphatidate phosphatase LPIN
VHHKKYAEAKAEFTLKQKLNNNKYRKTTRLSSDLIKKLNLKPGPNEIKYSVTTALQGTTRIVSYIFLWNYDDKIIVSDIDGTITKSDVWGQVLPIFGRDWSQAGVADLFTAIQRNEYKFIYLSARAIGQSKLTRDLLRNINQDGFTLPEGPLLVTPTSLFTAFQKEVIERKPEEFKISCLRDIQSLFPANNNPYYAGYGNKPTDVTSYKAVGIPVSRIFTINPQGEVKYEVSRTFQSSYSKLCDYVDLIFPPFKASSSIIKAEYDAFNYWRDDPTCNNDKFMAEIDALVNIKEKNGKNAKKSKSQVSILVDNNVETIRKNVNDK